MYPGLTVPLNRSWADRRIVKMSRPPKPESSFVMIPNDWVRDPKLSFKAKGLLAYLLTHEEGYDLTIEQIVAETADSRNSVYRTLNSLIEAGYLTRKRSRDERGRLTQWTYVIGPTSPF